MSPVFEDILKRNLYQCKYKPAVNSSGRTSWSWQFHLTNWWWPSSHSQGHICYTRSTKEPGSQLHGYDAYPFFEPPVILQSHRFYHQLRGGQTRSWHFTLHVWVQFYRFSLYTYRMIYTLYYMHVLIYIYIYTYCIHFSRCTQMPGNENHDIIYTHILHCRATHIYLHEYPYQLCIDSPFVSTVVAGLGCFALRGIYPGCLCWCILCQSLPQGRAPVRSGWFHCPSRCWIYSRSLTTIDFLLHGFFPRISWTTAEICNPSGQSRLLGARMCTLMQFSWNPRKVQAARDMKVWTLIKKPSSGAEVRVKGCHSPFQPRRIYWPAYHDGVLYNGGLWENLLMLLFTNLELQ